MSPLELIVIALLSGGGGYGLSQLQRRRSAAPWQAISTEVRELRQALQRAADAEVRHERELSHCRGRLAAHTDALAAGSEKQQELDERLARVVSDTLQMGIEIKGQISDLDAALNAMSKQQQGLLQAFDGQLQEMQAFIVKAAEDAAKQRALLSAAAPAAVRQQPAVDDVELQQLLSRQQALQQQFAQRRRTEGEAAFRTPNGAGL